MNVHVGSRYLQGFVLLEIKSTEMGEDSEKYYLINRLCVEAIVDKTTNYATLVVFTDVEIVDINEKGEGVGYFQNGREIYKLPFPENLALRKQILKLIKKHVAVLLATTPTLYW